VARVAVDMNKGNGNDFVLSPRLLAWSAVALGGGGLMAWCVALLVEIASRGVGAF
jgi:hypothetical protein